MKKRSLLWLALAAVVAGCALPILGGATMQTTSHACPGTAKRCPNGFECPPYANPDGPCEARSGMPAQQWGSQQAR